MRKHRAEIAFVSCAIVTGVLGYLALLGDSGLWRRRMLSRDMQRLEQSVGMLRQENGVLFARLHGTGGRPTAEARRSTQDMWVLKFEGSPEARGEHIVRPEERMSLGEARILFAVGFVLFVLVGLYFTATVMRGLTGPADIVSEEGE